MTNPDVRHPRKKGDEKICQTLPEPGSQTETCLQDGGFVATADIQHLGDGKFEHAGVHLRIIVCRRESDRCELIRTRGVYLNLKEDISKRILYLLPPNLKPIGVYLNLKEDISKPTKNSYFELGEGDLMVLYSDGLTEAEDPGGQMLDIGGFAEIVEKHAHHEPEAMKEMIVADVIRWCDDNRADDMTLVIVKRKGGLDG